MRLSRDERRVIVADLAEQGMSTRAIAPVVGAGIGTVSRDLNAGVPNGTPVAPEPPEPTFDPTPTWDPTTGEVVDPRTVTEVGPEAQKCMASASVSRRASTSPLQCRIRRGGPCQ